MMYVPNSPSFQNFISIYGQNSVKILTKPYRLGGTGVWLLIVMSNIGWIR